MRRRERARERGHRHGRARPRAAAVLGPHADDAFQRVRERPHQRRELPRRHERRRRRPAHRGLRGPDVHRDEPHAFHRAQQVRQIP